MGQRHCQKGRGLKQVNLSQSVGSVQTTVFDAKGYWRSGLGTSTLEDRVHYEPTEKIAWPFCFYHSMQQRNNPIQIHTDVAQWAGCYETP